MRCARAAEVAGAEPAPGIVGVDVPVRQAQALEVGPDGDEVRVLALGAAAVGASRVRADHIVVGSSGAQRVVAAGGDDGWVVGRVGQPWRTLSALVSGVPGGGDNDDPLPPRLFDGEGKRVGVGRLQRVGAVGQVEDTDIHSVVVLVRHHPVDGGDDLGDVSAAVGGGHLERDDAGVGGHTAICGGGGQGIRRGEGVVFAGDEPSHERAVTEGVEVAQVRRLGLQR